MVNKLNHADQKPTGLRNKPQPAPLKDWNSAGETETAARGELERGADSSIPWKNAIGRVIFVVSGIGPERHPCTP